MALEDFELKKTIELVLGRIKKNIIQANSNNELENYLKSIRCDDFILKYNTSYDTRHAKILIIGESQVSKDKLLQIAKKNGINPKRIELLTDYEKLTNFNFGLLEYNGNYSDIIIGPCPHKAMGIKNNSSPIAMFTKFPERFPKVIKAIVGTELKITKTSFTEALLETQQYLDMMV